MGERWRWKVNIYYVPVIYICCTVVNQTLFLVMRNSIAINSYVFCDCESKVFAP